MEHLHHFGMKSDPFQNEPDLRFYFDSSAHADPQRRVERALRQCKGLTVLSGEGGTGKTLLSRRILECLEEELFEAHLMMMLPGACDSLAVLGRYARMLGVEEVPDDRPAMLAQIYEKLAIVREEGRHAILIIDDAHLLDAGALSGIGALLNLEYEDRRLLSVLMVGLPQVDVSLGHEPSLGQRIDVRAQIKSLDFGSVSAYLLHRLGLAGAGSDILPEESISALFKFGRGRPRLINTLADNALFEAYLGGRSSVTSDDVERAAFDLGVGLEPGSTYNAMPSSDGSSPASASANSDGLGEGYGGSGAAEISLDDSAPSLVVMQESDTGYVLGGGSDDPVMGSSGVDLGDLLEASNGDSSPMIGSAASEHEGLPVFEAQNSVLASGAEATRIAMPEEEAPTTSQDDLDDLFVELIDD